MFQSGSQEKNQTLQKGAVHTKNGGIFWLFFNPPHHVGILTLIYLTSTF